MKQFLRFGTVGAAGFLTDWASVELLRPFIGLTGATVCAYFIAATGNWLLNRAWTFRAAAHAHAPAAQWLRFLAANSVGFALNRGAVFTLYATVPLTTRHPVFALAGGAACGLLANFHLSRRLVFHSRPPAENAAFPSGAQSSRSKPNPAFSRNQHASHDQQ